VDSTTLAYWLIAFVIAVIVAEEIFRNVRKKKQTRSDSKENKPPDTS